MKYLMFLIAMIATAGFIAHADDDGKAAVAADMKKLEQDRLTRNQDQQRVVQDKATLKQDVKSAAGKDKVAADRQVLAQDRKARNEAQKDVKSDRKALKEARHKELKSEKQ
jgi:hypothetical protein